MFDFTIIICQKYIFWYEKKRNRKKKKRVIFQWSLHLISSLCHLLIMTLLIMHSKDRVIFCKYNSFECLLVHYLFIFYFITPTKLCVYTLNVQLAIWQAVRLFSSIYDAVLQWNCVYTGLQFINLLIIVKVERKDYTGFGLISFSLHE